jgi:hypothetical protein
MRLPLSAHMYAMALPAVPGGRIAEWWVGSGGAGGFGGAVSWGREGEGLGEGKGGNGETSGGRGFKTVGRVGVGTVVAHSQALRRA